MRTTRWRVWSAGLFSLVLSLSLACGPGGPSTGGPSQPDGGAGGGGGGGSGPTAGGSPSGGGGGSASNPGSGGTDGGNGGASGGTGGDGSGGATSGGSGGSSGGGDGGMGGGTPSAACAGLVPAFGAAVDVRFDTGTHNTCMVATSGPSGQVAVGIGGSNGIQFLLHSAGGEEQGRVDGMVQRYAIQDIDPWFHWTSGGYHGIVHPGRLASPLPFESWDTSGAFVGETGSYTVSSAPDGSGGSIVLAREPTPSGATLGPTQLQWVDASGAVKRSVTLDRDAGFVLSNWGTGHVLVAVAGSGASARWFDGAGKALTPWFGVGDLPILTAHLLADGAIVLADGGGWRVALRDGIASADAVPGWLAARPQTRLATVRHAQGYALLPLDGKGESFEIVTAAGESCGSFTLPPAPAVAGETRTPGQRLDVGQDGTLLELSFVSTAAPSFGIHCNFRWWPALLR